VVTLTSENFEAEVTKGTWLVKLYEIVFPWVLLITVAAMPCGVGIASV
jgi:hypothetical protein